IEYPGAINIHTPEEIRDNLAREVIDPLIRALTVEESGESESAPPPLRPPRETVFEGNLEEVNRFFLEKGWTDGHAIIPPTPEKIARFLEYTDLPPDGEIAVLPQAKLRATPRNIAANAVMAGCRPEHLPVLIAAVEAVADPLFDLMQLGTTGAIHPFLLLNGPIVKEMGFNHGVGAISHPPNVAVARAFGLILRNIAGFKPGEMWMGTFGYFPPFLIAEDEAGSPWETYHTGHGFRREDSTVTAAATMNWGPQVFLSSPDAEAMLKLVALGLYKTVIPHAFLFGPRAMAMVLITPPTAKALADAGYPKKRAEEWLQKNTTMPPGEAAFLLANSTERHETVASLIQKGVLPASIDPDKEIPVMTGREGMVEIVVCGDPARSKVQPLWTCYQNPVTRRIKLPRNRDKLLRNEKNKAL
ncbi:MAG: hypothetical protein ABID87_00260, partial [Chloroflexota bacterium]